ncbi:MAG TPA: autotransporter outer membrane beta-barrel domain-containing protein, partial [Pirellulales bacterium]
GSGLGFSILYDPLGIELLITSVGTNFAADAQTSNQLAVANVLDATSGTATGDYAYVIGQLETLSSGQMPGALDQLAGDIYPSISAIELQTTTTWMQLLSNRLAQQLRPVAIDGGVEGVSMTGDRYLPEIRLVSFQGSNGQVQQGSQLILRRVSYVPSWTGWTQGYGLGGGVNGNGNAGGLNYGLGGTLFGIDRWLDDNTAVGVTGGYAGTTLRDRLDSDHASINAGQVGVYQLYRNGRFYFSNIDAYSGGNYRVTRPIDFASVTRVANGASSGNQYAHYSEAGLTFGNGRLRLQPFTGLQYIYLDQHGYNETGADSVDLMTSGQYVNSVRGNFGGRVYSERIWRGIRVIPSASARYQREWGNGTQLISSSFAGAPTSSFVTAGNFLGRNFGLFTLSSTALLSERTSIFAALDSQVSQNYYAVIGSGGFQYRW